MRAMRLLCASSVDSRLSGGKPSSFTISLSLKSMQSNWFCTGPVSRETASRYAPRACVTARFSTELSLCPARAGRRLSTGTRVAG